MRSRLLIVVASIVLSSCVMRDRTPDLPNPEPPVIVIPPIPDPPQPPVVVAPPANLTKIHVAGTEFRDEADARFIPIFASELSILRRSSVDRIERLKEVKALGFNGIRVFAGALTWAEQSAALAQEKLPELLQEAQDVGLYVLVTALTDTGTGYDATQHLWAQAATAKRFSNALFELANEVGHSTQSPQVNDAEWLAREGRAIFAGSSTVWAVGAPIAFDEPTPEGVWPFPTGDFITAHLDRGRDPLNMARRVRELFAIKEATRKPVWNSEPIGFDEVERPGSRLTDCSIAYALAVLNNAFSIAHLYHSQAGLMAEPFGPKQRACAVAFVTGANK